MPRPLILLRLENLRAEKTIVVGHRQPIGNFLETGTTLKGTADTADSSNFLNKYLI